MASGDTKTEAMLNVLGNGGSGDEFRGCCNTKTQGYILDAIDRVNNVEEEVEELKNNPDVVDIVDTYADLQAYDTQHLTDNDIIRVLQDETHSGNSTYYRFTKNPDTWTFIGEISGGGGGDTVYSDKTTSNSRDGGAIYIGDKNATQSVVNDPTTTDNHYRYLWAMPFSSAIDATTVIPGDETINIGGVQGNHPNEMSGGTHNVNIGYRSKTGTWTDAQTVVGWQAQSRDSYCTAYGANANAAAQYGTAIGYDAQCWEQNSVALGKGAYPTRAGEVNIKCDYSGGFNNTYYRVIGGVHDGQELHDAATVAQGNTLASSAPTTSTVGVLGQLYTDTTNMQTYQCTAINGNTYTWTAFGGGGGGGSSVTTYYVDPAFTFDETPQSVSLYKDDALTTTATGAEIYDAVIAGSVRIAQIDPQSQADYMCAAACRMPVANTDAAFSLSGGIIMETPYFADSGGSRVIYTIVDRTANSIECFLRPAGA